jgi:hypothetical protein
MNEKLLDAVFSEVTRAHNDFNRRLDDECRRVLLAAGFTEPFDAELIKEQQITVVYTPDGAARICQDGAVISNVIYPSKFIGP